MHVYTKEKLLHHLQQLMGQCIDNTLNVSDHLHAGAHRLDIIIKHLHGEVDTIIRYSS